MSKNFIPFEIPLEQLQDQDFWDDEEFINECMQAEVQAQAENNMNYIYKATSENGNAEIPIKDQSEECSIEIVPEFLCADPNLPLIFDRLRIIKEQAMKEREDENFKESLSTMAKSWFECGLESSKYFK